MQKMKWSQISSKIGHFPKVFVIYIFVTLVTLYIK